MLHWAVSHHFHIKAVRAPSRTPTSFNPPDKAAVAAGAGTMVAVEAPHLLRRRLLAREDADVATGASSVSRRKLIRYI